MAVAKNTRMIATVESQGGTGSEKICFRSNENLYTGTFSTASGIAKAAGPDLSRTPTSVHQLVRGGLLYRCKVTIAGDTNDPPQTRSVLVANNKLKEFQAWASQGSNTLPGGPARPVISGGLRMGRVRYE